MAGNNYFQFKQFTIVQEKSAMKVGIDGVLLGAWVRVEEAKTILDIGTGTGLISLMMAQRTNAHIDTVEIDQDAFEEAKFNIEHSPWAERIRIYHNSFQSYLLNCTQKYDLIVSNPPFFENSVGEKSEKRYKARDSFHLNISELIEGSKSILSDKGHLALIFPYQRKNELIQVASQNSLWITRQMILSSNAEKEPHRVLVEFGNKLGEISETKLAIRKVGKHEYSDDYKVLTKDFYLHF